jgi:hypothetical protein
METFRKIMENIWENHGKYIGKSWKRWENHGKYIGKSWKR